MVMNLHMTRNDLEKKIESKIDTKLFAKSKRKKLSDGFKGNKVINEVLDKSTVFTLYDLIKSKLSHINGTVRAGKESVIFWAVNDAGKDIALKVYLVSTSNFKKREQYILGDPRFSRNKKGNKKLGIFMGKKRIYKFESMF